MYPYVSRLSASSAHGRARGSLQQSITQSNRHKHTFIPQGKRRCCCCCCCLLTHAHIAHAQGKTGESLQYISARKDRELAVDGQGRDVLMRHGDFRQPPVDTAASLYSLTYGSKQLGEPPVQSYLWSGVNRIDATVPMRSSNLALTRTKVQEWTRQADPYSGFETTARSSSLAAAVAAASFPEKRGTLRPEADSGQLAQVNEHPVAVCVWGGLLRLCDVCPQCGMRWRALCGGTS